jgi:hypothetical protein
MRAAPDVLVDRASNGLGQTGRVATVGYLLKYERTLGRR